MFRRFATDILMRVMIAKGKKSLRDLENSARDPMKDNLKLLNRILKKNQNTEYGRLHHFAEIHSVEDFRTAVPLSDYHDFSAYIDRSIAGEKNLLTADNILGYSRTSGSSGVPKYIPGTKGSLIAYTKYAWTRALALAVEKMEGEGKRYRPGRGIYSSPAMNTVTPNGLPCSNIAEIVARRYSIIYPYIMTIPGKKLFALDDGDYLYSMFRFALEDQDTTLVFSVFYSLFLSQMAYLKEHWQIIVDDMEKGVINESIEMKPALRAELSRKVHPMPERAAYLRRQFEQGFDSTILIRLWPNMVVLSGIGGASFQDASERMRGYAERIPMDFSVYASSEGLYAACYELENRKMQLLTDSCFFEFIPETDEEATTILTIDQLELGKRYEVVATTQAGLYRYRMKDIIEVVGFRDKTPLINFIYRRGQLLNLSGEKFTEEDARTTISMLEKAHGITVNNWIFYQDDSVSPGRYVLLTECGDNTVLTDDMIDEIEDYMGYCCKRYPDQRAKYYIGRLKLETQRPGTHEQWRQKCADAGAYRFQVKPVHSLDNDAKREFFLSRIEDNVTV